MKKLIINLAPTGMVPTRAMTPYVPITPEEIITDVEKCIPLGVSMVHLHARENDGTPTYKKDIYSRIIYALREKYPDLIIVVSTSGRTFSEFEKRSEALDLKGDCKPDMASLTLSSLNFIKTASVNAPTMIMKLAEKMMENDIKPELEVFDMRMMNFAHYLIRKDLIKPPYYFNILLGSVASAQAKLSHLGLLTAELPNDSYYGLAGIGESQKYMNALGVISADGLRVGLEDNIWLDEERTAKATNYDLVYRMSEIAKAFNREVASPNEVRKMLNL